MKPKIVVLCGSSRFVDIMAVCAWVIERDEKAIAMGLHLLPQWYPDVPKNHLAEHEGCKNEMDELHLRKIDLADEVFVVDYTHYIGESTANEIEYTKTQGKPVRYFSKDQVGEAVIRMIREDLEGWDPGMLPICRKCGCSKMAACPGGCSWVEEDLCSQCVEAK
jgi:hypothetical protein